MGIPNKLVTSISEWCFTCLSLFLDLLNKYSLKLCPVYLLYELHYSRQGTTFTLKIVLICLQRQGYRKITDYKYVKKLLQP